MIITIIGSGNVATVLGKLFKTYGHSINEIAGRNKSTVVKLAKELNANTCTDLQDLNKRSDLYVIAVRDDAVASVAAAIKLKEQIVVHSCGSASMNVLSGTSINYGILYPLQSLRKELNYTPVIPFLVDGINESTKENIFNFASLLSENVAFANDETRLKYHLSAIVTANFTNHLFALAKDYCIRNNTDFNLLLPLIKETVSRLNYFEPSSMQTGPAMRGDETTMQKHIEMLASFPQLKKIYQTMSESIIQLKKS